MSHTHTFLTEDANTRAADINELAVGYYLNGSTWWSSGVVQQYTDLSGDVTAEVLRVQLGRAAAMASAIRQHYGTLPVITGLEWVGRDRSNTHPADLIVTFTSGKRLGISCKSTSSLSDGVGFANPGLRRIETALGISVLEIRDRVAKKLVSQYRLPERYTDRMTWLSEHPRLAEQIHAAGWRVIGRMRDAVLAGLQSMPGDQVREYLLREWLVVDATLDPPYVIVVGRGNGPFTGEVYDPLQSPVTQALQDQPLRFTSIGRGSIGVYAGDVPVLGIRIKWAKGPFASSVEAIGEPIKT